MKNWLNRHTLKLSSYFFILLLVFLNDELRANENESVVVTGRRLEVDRSRANGQSILISPLEASRFDTLVHLRRESSVLAPESGRISPSGFVVPSIRGQDVKLTEVYLEDTLLQDPYSGLPLIEDIDLRAFGTLEIHQGLPPPEVPGLNPIGTLRYRFRNTSKNQFKAGLQSGSIFGFSQWTLGAFHHKGENNGTDARMYARHHQTSGRFPFYSDRSTPYNSGDDTIEVRANNDQLSQQAVPWLRYHNGPYAVEAMGWLYDAKRGLPSMSVAVPSEAREAAEGYLGNIRLSRDFAGVGAGPAFNVSLHATQNLDQRGVLDPSQRFLSSAKSSEMRVRSKRVGLNIVSKKGKTDTFAAFEAGQTSVQSQLDSRKSDALDRHAHTNSLGIRLYPWPLFAVEAKATQRIHRDHLGAAAASITLPEEDQNAGRQRAATAMGASFSFANATQGVYGQIATAQRLPSLIEEFGNGSNIRPNSRLNPEATRHQEFGLFVQEHESLWRGSLVVYKDKTADKIIFIPIMANATKAANIRSTVVRGIDLRTELKFADLSFFASMSRLYPYDETRAPRRYLPGIPGQVYVLEAEGRLQGITGRWLARYKDKVYRDLANSIQIPGIWIHDASLDSSFSLQKIDFQLGLSLRNIFNLMSMPIEAPDTLSNKGRTAYADYSGAPLPGRQWQLALTLTL